MVSSACAVGFVALILIAPAASASSGASTSYRPTGYYVGPVDVESNIQPPRVILGRHGIPLVSYPRVGYRSNPVTAAQYGLWAYNMFLKRHDERYRAIVLRVADWLVATQRSGRWLYGFDLDYRGIVVKKPWSSAMAQGQAMSLLERAYVLTGAPHYRRAAVRALGPLELNLAQGGLSSCFLGDCSKPFFQEAPTIPASYILNGFMFTLIGLYDLSAIAPYSKAHGLYASGRNTLHDALPRYDAHGVASYDLTATTVHGLKPSIASPSYQAVHVYLLRALDSIRADPRLAYYANRWERNEARVENSRGSRSLTPASLVLLFLLCVIAVALWRTRARRTRRASRHTTREAPDKSSS